LLASEPLVPGSVQSGCPAHPEPTRTPAETVASRLPVVFCGRLAVPCDRDAGCCAGSTTGAEPGLRVLGFAAGVVQPSFTVSFFREKVTES